MEDYRVTHPDTTGDLLRSWKNDLIWGEFSSNKQIPFEDWLRKKQQGIV